MSSPSVPEPYAPRRPAAVAALVFIAAALTLCWPMLTGQFLLGSDQYVAGYGFRLFAAEHFRTFGEIPQWNPYLFGGLPFMGAMHGDIFYPTTLLRWILPTDVAMNFGFAVHIVLAGFAMYRLLRTLRLSFGIRRRNWIWLRPTLAGVVVLGGVVLAPIFLPILSPESTARYGQWLGVVPQIERGKTSPLPQWLADRFDWEGLRFEVVGMDGRRLERVQVRRTAG